MRSQECYQCRVEVTWFSLIVNIFQASLKWILGIMYNSSALIADGVHSSVDVISSSVTMVSVKISSKPPSEKYTYGYGNAQFISEAIVGTLLILGASYLFVHSTINIMTGNLEVPGKITILGASVSIIMNALLFKYQSCVAKENNSPAIMSNAWDNRSDALSSVAVLVGIIFATFGFPAADPLAAIAVSLVIVKIGVELIMDAINGLMDHSPDLNELHEVYYASRKVQGVRGISSLRIRRSGETSSVDIGIQVRPELKVYEGDLIALAVKSKIIKVLGRAEVQVFVGV
ncbi:magnetosome biogenesis CDF transporter MamB [Deltaproteobacteria bacterium TL4]